MTPDSQIVPEAKPMQPTTKSEWVRLLIIVALVVATFFVPAWPVVFAVGLAVLYAAGHAVLDFIGGREARLDVEARRAANKAALVADENIRRLKVVEDAVNALRVSAGPARMGGNGFPRSL